ncbi:MAG: helix-turn-helix domain-containing protein, partial [Gammaproteobacteria bacterium]|nr:helix-turn-helix domain-containing protein [Gammaproteobacteria bacterium]
MNIPAFKKARQSRDPRFDGHFFVAVLSTGIYCRPVCPARLPREENVRYFLTAAAAVEDGYRPCLRCKPESAPAHGWNFAPDLLRKGLGLIEEGVAEEGGVRNLAARVGVSTRHLGRLFKEHLGTSPQMLIRMRRVQLA